MSYDEKREHKLFIGGLHLNTTTESLREFYSQWGELVDAVVMRDGNTKRSRGFGFVTYADEESMERCMNQRPHHIDGREVEAKIAVPREEQPIGGSNSSSAPPVAQQGLRTKKVFLGGLHLDTTDDEIREMLSTYGHVEEVTIKTDPDTNKPRGFGFAILDNFEGVDQLCSERYVKIHDRDVEVKKAQSAEEMRRKDGGRHGGPPSSRGHGGGYGQGGGGRMAGYGGASMEQYAYHQPRYPTNYMPEYYRGGDPYMGMNPGYAAAAAYGDRSGIYAAAAAAGGYRNPYEGAATTPGVAAAYGMYGSYGGAASGYGPMRGYGGGGGGSAAGVSEQSNGAAYGGRNTSGRVYHPYKR